MLPRKFPCHYTEEENTFSRPWWRGSVNQLQPANRSVGGWIRCQGTSLGCWGRSQQGTFNRRSHFDLVLPHFLSPFPSPKKINKIFKKKIRFIQSNHLHNEKSPMSKQNRLTGKNFHVHITH